MLALATGTTPQEIAAVGKHPARTISASSARHKRASRIEERDRKRYARQSTGVEQAAAGLIQLLEKSTGRAPPLRRLCSTCAEMATGDFSTRIVSSSRGDKMPKLSPRLFAVILVLLTGLSARAVGATEIKVVCAGAMRAVLQQLAPAFEKSSGDKLVIEYATAGKVEEEVAADEPIDVAILTKPRADKLVRAAKLVGGTTTMLARVPIGLAVKSGAPHPDISSVEAVKRTLRGATSIAYIDPASGGTSGIFLARAFEKLGIAAELKSKIRLVSPSGGQSSPRVGEVVQRGEAEIGIQPISELMEIAGIDVVGPLPADLQSQDLVYVAGSPAASEQPLLAKSLIDFLTAPANARVYKSNGMDPAGTRNSE
jgi:molybdate transport system substrate-binding protein